ncbi:MAG TPA: four helix bundle protein [Holophagaceae bacterium]|nr:four helix bundle protein [Holophagaceae bacterium]
MTRDPKDLRVFQMADQLVESVYRATRGFPAEERFGLQSQIRRAAVSVPGNIVEGCARRSEKEYLHFLVIALGSASELKYFLGLSCRLGFLPKGDADPLDQTCADLLRALQKLVDSIGGSARRLTPDA